MVPEIIACVIADIPVVCNQCAGDGRNRICSTIPLLPSIGLRHVVEPLLIVQRSRTGSPVQVSAVHVAAECVRCNFEFPSLDISDYGGASAAAWSEVIRIEIT